MIARIRRWLALRRLFAYQYGPHFVHNGPTGYPTLTGYWTTGGHWVKRPPIEPPQAWPR